MVEPMTLGSPGNVSPGFMPTFLLGEMATAACSLGQSSGGDRATGTPLKSPRRVTFAPADSPITVNTSTTNVSLNQSLLSPRFPRQRQILQNETPPAPHSRRGPPTLSLSDTLPRSPVAGVSLNQSASLGHTSFVGIPLRTDVSSPFEPDEDLMAEEANKWVTVFGFPASMVPSVLTWLSNCGSVTVRHLPSSPRANWVHLRFSSAAEARRALGRNLHMLGPDVMIGVAPCTDKEVMRTWRQGAGDSFSEAGGTFIFSSQLLPPPGALNSTLQLTNTSVMNSSMRSLAASPDISVEPSLLPRRSVGVVSKAMDYIFGW